MSLTSLHPATARFHATRNKVVRGEHELYLIENFSIAYIWVKYTQCDGALGDAEHLRQKKRSLCHSAFIPEEHWDFPWDPHTPPQSVQQQSTELITGQFGVSKCLKLKELNTLHNLTDDQKVIHNF